MRQNCSMALSQTALSGAADAKLYRQATTRTSGRSCPKARIRSEQVSIQASVPDT